MKKIKFIFEGVGTFLVTAWSIFMAAGLFLLVCESTGFKAVGYAVAALVASAFSLAFLYSIGEGQSLLDKKFRKEDEDGRKKIQNGVVGPKETCKKQECTDTSEA